MAAAMVLCAGYGTRLRPLSDELPKPLLPLGDRPQLAHVCDQLRHFGASPIVVNVHHLRELFARELESMGLGVGSVIEPELRGTAGGLAGARVLLGSGPVVVWNGDIIVAPPLAALCRRIEETDARAVLLVSPRPIGHGRVGMDSDGRIVRLRDQSFGPESFGGDYVGVSILADGCLDEMPTRGCLVGDYLMPLLAKRVPLGGLLYRGSWRDAGTPRTYHRANLHWLGERQDWVGAGASVAASVTLRDCVVGKGARVVGDGELRRVVVWPRATASAPLADAIVTPRGIVRV